MQAAEGRQQWTLTFGGSEIRSRAAGSISERATTSNFYFQVEIKTTHKELPSTPDTEIDTSYVFMPKPFIV